MAIKLADAFIEVILDYAKAEKEADNMEKRIGGLTTGTITKLSAGMTAAGAAITGTLGVAASKAAEFGENLANVSTLGVKDIGALDEGTRDLAVKFGIDLNDAMKATYETISAGIPEDAAIMVMEQAARGAQAGVGSLGDALDLGTSVMNAWNIKGKDAAGTAAEMEKIMGMAATAAFKGKTTFAEMATSIGQVAPVMSAAGVGTDEFFAAVSALTATGKPTSSAMLQLQQAVSNVIKPSEEAKKMAASLGLEFDAQALKSKGLAGFLDSVKEATGGNVEQMGVLFGSVEALGAAISLTGNQAGIFKESLTEMGSAQKTLNDMQNAFLANNPGQALKIAKAAMQELFILIGRSVIPVLVELAKVVTPIVTFLSDFMTNHPVISAGIGTIALAVGGLTLALGTLGFAIVGLAPGVAAISGAGGFGGLAALFGTTGAAAGAAAGATGFGALTAGAIALGATVLPIVGLLTIIGLTFTVVGPVIASTARAFVDLAASNQAVNDKTLQYVDLLQRQGIALDKDKIARMSHAEQLTTINNALIQSREEAAAREIQSITGIEATRQQIHIAELARVGLEVSAKEAALMAVQGVTQAEIESLMAKGDAATAITQRTMGMNAQAAAASSEMEIAGRTDRTETIGHFEWAADKEAQLIQKIGQLKQADFGQRKILLRDISDLEAQKAAAEQQWANENQALTASEIAGMQFKVQQKEQADARYLAIAEGTMKAEKDQLYVNLSDQVASLKVHGDASVRQKAYEAEQRKKLAESMAKVETDLESKVGKEKLDLINKTITSVQEQGDFEKLTAEQVAGFKAEVLKGDLDTAMQYWGQQREMANAGYITSLEQYKSFSNQMKAEAASLRQALAYAANPAQTGSPSLNMEIAAGLNQSRGLYAGTLNSILSDMSMFRQSAVGLLNGLGATIIGGTTANPTPSDVAKPTGSTPLNGSGNVNAPVSVSAPINITIAGGIPTDGQTQTMANTMSGVIVKHVSKALGQQAQIHARGRGIRSPGYHRNIIVPG